MKKYLFIDLDIKIQRIYIVASVFIFGTRTQVISETTSPLSGYSSQCKATNVVFKIQ